MSNNYKIKKKEKIPGSIMQIEVEVTSEALMKHWSHALEHIGSEVEMPGFRKGHVPEKVLIGKVGEMTILEECAEHALGEIYPDIIESEKLRPIGSPKVIITKIAKGSDLEASLRISLFPEITLPDYKKIAEKINSKKEEIVVEEKEVEDVLNEIKKHRKDGEKEIEINDEFVKKLGDFKDVEDFKAKIKENITKEKEFRAQEKKRIEMLEEMRKGSKIDLPDILVENELDKMTHEFSGQLGNQGHSLEKYLSEIKKTETDMRNEWKPKALERVQIELILFEIARLEKISPNKEDVEKETTRIAEHYPTTPRERIIAFVEDALTKEEVFKFLEK